MTTTTGPQRPGVRTLDTIPSPATDRTPLGAARAERTSSGATHVQIPVPAPVHPAGELVHPWAD